MIANDNISSICQNSLVQALVNLILSHPFKIIASLLFSSFHALCSHSNMHGFRLFVWSQCLDFHHHQYVLLWPLLSNC